MEEILTMTSRGSEAKGGWIGREQFLVKKGSRVSPDVAEGFRDMMAFYQRLYLYAEHIIGDDDKFKRDYTFPSAAMAASVISGTKGLTSMWKHPVK